MTDESTSDEDSRIEENQDEVDDTESLLSAGEAWRTPVIRSQDGEVVGASFFLTVEDLQDMGIVIEDDAVLLYSISDSTIEIFRKQE